MNVIDLDKILLSEEAVAAWMAIVPRVARAFQAVGIRPEEIPDERARIESDGSLKIFVEVPGGCGEISLTIPPESWARLQ